MVDKSRSWTVKCQDSGDGSGDAVVDLPPELIAEMGWKAGDELSIECEEGVIVLTPIRNASDAP
ncbi:hypothetical protein D3C86_2224020 [compost metagenome]